MTYGSEPSLFDLSAAPSATESEPDPPTASLDDLPLFGNLDEPEPAAVEQFAEEQPRFEFGVDSHVTESDPVEDDQGSLPRSGPIEGPAALTDRLGASLLDLAVMAGAAITLVGGAAVLGATPHLADWPLIAFPWLLFSFLYHVVSLAFWGRTPGMASMSLTARTLDDRPLSLSQAVRRWLATLATAALAGIPGLLALSGRSATDRLSQSVTRWKAPSQASAA